MVILRLPDGSEKEVKSGETFLEFIEREIGAGLARNAVAVSLNGKLFDVSAEAEGEISMLSPQNPKKDLK